MRDISLSEAHGGLRIANPDDAATATATAGLGELTLNEHDTRYADASRHSATSDHRSRTPLLESFPIINESPAHKTEGLATPWSSGPPELPQYPSSVNSPITTSQSPSQHPPQSTTPSAVPSREPLWRNTSSQSQLRVGENGRARATSRAEGEGYTPTTFGVQSVEPARSSMYIVSTKSDPSAMMGRPMRERSIRDSTQTAINRRPVPPDSSTLPPRRSSRGQAGGYVSGSTGASAGITKPSHAGPELPRPEATAEWQDKGTSIGTRRGTDSNGNPVTKSIKRGPLDFKFGKVLGEGSYSTVYSATDRHSHKEYAIKVLQKVHIIKEKKVKYVNIEKDTLNRLTEHPGIVRLYYTFQDDKSLYYVLDLCNGGELLVVLKRTGTFNVECTRYYGAQLLDAMEYMHSKDVLHRDLKPENVLLDGKMHLKITDFGTAKMLTRGDETGEIEESRTSSFVGTAEYVSPELLINKSAGKPSDIWAFGCIIFQLLAGRPPFKAGTEYLTFQRIIGLEYDFPEGFPATARDLVERCLVTDPSSRITTEHIKKLPFFAEQSFGPELWRGKAPRLAPHVPNQEASTIDVGSTSSRAPHHSTSRGLPTTNASARPARLITELPPPTQLDIEWSPVLTRNNERILKLGDLSVISSPLSNGSDHNDGHKKFSRFFGGGGTKRRQRLVMVTSSGRIVLAAAGGDEKKSKQEIPLLAPDCRWQTQIDPKGQPVWCVDNNGVHYTFELPKSSATDPNAPTVDDWVGALNKAKDLALAADPTGTTYDANDDFGDMPSVSSTPASTFGQSVQYPEGGFGISDRSGRNQLTKNQASPEDNVKRHRFSRRQSKNGLLGTAAF